MKKIKFLFQQAMTISTGILFCSGLEGVCFHFMGDDISLEWYHPISIILAGILCALPSLIWLQEEHLNRRQFIVRLVLHCIFLFAVVSLMVYGYNRLLLCGGGVFYRVCICVGRFLLAWCQG